MLKRARRRLRIHSWGVLAAAGLALALLGLSPASAEETIHLIPDDKADWTPGNVFGFLRASHNYGERFIKVETVPSGAFLDLFYIRSNFQKRYEQTEAPVKIILPQRIDAGPRDAVMIRAFMEGYRQKEASIRVSSKQENLLLELEPLPNMLVAASHVYLAGRSSMAFLTKEALTVRVQNRSDGFGVVLAETAKSEQAGATLAQVTSPHVAGVEAIQLGEDLLVRVETRKAAGEYELRSRQSLDELRDLYVYSVELVPSDGGIEAARKARAALAAIGAAEVSGCAERFDETLRTALDPSALSRALSERGAFTDRYIRAAMKRLGAVSADGRIRMTDGSTFLGSSGLELAAAMSQPGEAKGFLALLRAFVDRVEEPDHRHSTLRGLLAPELPPDQFEAAYDRAESAEKACRA